MRSARSCRGMSRATASVSANASMKNGFTSNAALSSSEAPAKRLRTSTPLPSVLHEIHSVLKRRHDAHVGCTVHGGEEIRVDVLVHEDDRCPVERAEFIVEPRYRFEHVALQPGVRWNIRTRWRRNDQHRKRATTFRTVRPHVLQRPQSSFDSLGVIHSIDADHELPVARCVPLAQRSAHIGRVRQRSEPLPFRNIYADRKCSHSRLPTVQMDDALVQTHLGFRQCTRDAVHEIPREAVSLKLDQIVSQQPTQQRFLHSNGQNAKDIGGRKWNVPELMDQRIRYQWSYQRRRERKVIIMYPDHRCAADTLGLLHNGCGEQSVRALVTLPITSPDIDLADEQMA